MGGDRDDEYSTGVDDVSDTYKDYVEVDQSYEEVGVKTTVEEGSGMSRSE